MSYDSVTSNPNRLAQNKNFTLFEQDLAANTLPQWMFITPNMSSFYYTPICGAFKLTLAANDGHDTSVTAAGKWMRSFIVPLLSNSHFMKRTLVLISEIFLSLHESWQYPNLADSA